MTVPLQLAASMKLHRVLPALGERTYVPGYWDPNEPRRVDWATGAFLLVRRAAWDAAGGFDDDQWMYGEDLDLCWRLAHEGWLTRYEPRGRVRHVMSAAAGKAFGETMTDKAMSATWSWMARRRGLAATWALAAIRVAEGAAEMVLFRALSLVRPGRYAGRLRSARRAMHFGRLGLRRRATLLRPE
jgi:GT2 family glycosyltransferase